MSSFIDLGQPGAAARIEEELRELGLEAQFLVNNAGFGLMGLAASLDRAQQLAMIDLNVRVLTELSLRFVADLDAAPRRHPQRRLGGSFMPGPGMAVYHATKAYVLSFSEALHRELGGQGIRVTALCPGPVETEFMTLAGIPEGNFPNFLVRSAERVAQEGYDGLMRGRRVVVPGSANKGGGAAGAADATAAGTRGSCAPSRAPISSRAIRRVRGEACENVAAAPCPLLDRHRPTHQHHVFVRCAHVVCHDELIVHAKPAAGELFEELRRQHVAQPYDPNKRIAAGGPASIPMPLTGSKL